MCVCVCKIKCIVFICIYKNTYIHTYVNINIYIYLFIYSFIYKWYECVSVMFQTNYLRYCRHLWANGPCMCTSLGQCPSHPPQPKRLAAAKTSKKTFIEKYGKNHESPKSPWKISEVSNRLSTPAPRRQRQRTSLQHGSIRSRQGDAEAAAPGVGIPEKITMINCNSNSTSSHNAHGIVDDRCTLQLGIFTEITKHSLKHIGYNLYLDNRRF